MLRMRLVFRCSLLLLLFALSMNAKGRARAADAPRLRVVLIEPDRDPFLEEVGAEIENLGFAIARSARQGSLEAIARAEHAAAAIRVLPSRKGVEVWMADATSGRSLLRQVIVDERPGGPDRNLIALQTAELLRTSLLGEPAKPPETPAKVEVHETAGKAPTSPPTNRPPAPARTRDTGVQLAFGALYPPAASSPALELGLSLSHFVSERWGLGLDLAMPVGAAEFTGIEGSAAFHPYFAGASLLLRLVPQEGLFFAQAGAGASLVLLKYQGHAVAPLQSSSGTRLTGAVYAHADGGLALASWLRVGARALVGLSPERISVRFAGNHAGDFGPLFIAGFGFVEVALP